MRRRVGRETLPGIEAFGSMKLMSFCAVASYIIINFQRPSGFTRIPMAQCRDSLKLLHQEVYEAGVVYPGEVNPVLNFLGIWLRAQAAG